MLWPCFFLILAACSLEESDAKGIFVQGTEIAYGTLQVRNNPKSSPSAYSIHNTTIFFRVVHFENHSIVLSYELDELSFSRQKRRRRKNTVLFLLCAIMIRATIFPFCHITRMSHTTIMRAHHNHTHTCKCALYHMIHMRTNKSPKA